jgi:hypothetical protein
LSCQNKIRQVQLIIFTCNGNGPFLHRFEQSLCFGGVLLISSAKIIFEKTGPFINLNCRFSSNISLPKISEGIKSGKLDSLKIKSQSLSEGINH